MQFKRIRPYVEDAVPGGKSKRSVANSYNKTYNRAMKPHTYYVWYCPICWESGKYPIARHKSKRNGADHMRRYHGVVPNPIIHDIRKEDEE